MHWQVTIKEQSIKITVHTEHEYDVFTTIGGLQNTLNICYKLACFKSGGLGLSWPSKDAHEIAPALFVFFLCNYLLYGRVS